MYRKKVDHVLNINVIFYLENANQAFKNVKMCIEIWFLMYTIALYFHWYVYYEDM